MAADKSLLVEARRQLDIGEIDDALHSYSAAIALNSKAEAAYVGISEIYKRRSTVRSAITYLRSVVEGQRDLPNVSTYLANQLIDVGEFDAALSVYEDVLRYRPDFAKALHGKFSILCRISGFEYAIVWAEGVYGLLKTDIGKSDFMQKVCIEAARHFSSVVNLSASVRTGGRPIDDALMVGMFKDEGDVIYSQLKHSYNAGIRNFALADNLSEDETLDEITRFRVDFPEARVLIVSDSNPVHHQGKKTTALCHYAANYFEAFGAEINWVFPLDSDEFFSIPSSGGDLLSIVDSCDGNGKKIISLMLNNASTEAPVEKIYSSSFDLGMFSNRDRFARATSGKVGFKYSKGAEIRDGNHAVLGVASSPSEIFHAASVGAYLTHLQYRSLDHVERKIVNGGRAIDGLGSGAGTHWRADFDRYMARGSSYIEEKLISYIDSLRRN